MTRNIDPTRVYPEPPRPAKRTHPWRLHRGPSGKPMDRYSWLNLIRR